jgi:hypothetical protein
MQKFLATIILLSFVFALGCACPRTDANNVTTKSFLNCLLASQDMVCNPSESVLAVANAAAPFLITLLNTLVPGSQEFIDAANAKAAVDSIRNVGCISITSLNSLIAYLNKALMAQAKIKRGVYKAPFDTKALEEWAVTK